MAVAEIVGPRSAQPINGSWQVACLPAGSATDPVSLEASQPRWIACDGPMPVAAALVAAGELHADQPKDLDADDWWYRCQFASDSASPVRMTFRGLATVADVWLNGQLVLQSESMFIAHTIDVSATIRARNELVMRFRALAPLLAAKRPRPRWRTRLVSQQTLRWYRT